MKLEDLRRLKDQRPFRHFTIRLADGRKIRIRHPDAISMKEEYGGIATCLLPGGAYETMKVDSITLTGD